MSEFTCNHLENGFGFELDNRISDDCYIPIELRWSRDDDRRERSSPLSGEAHRYINNNKYKLMVDKWDRWIWEAKSLFNKEIWNCTRMVISFSFSVNAVSCPAMHTAQCTMHTYSRMSWQCNRTSHRVAINGINIAYTVLLIYINKLLLLAILRLIFLFLPAPCSPRYTCQ